MLEDSLLVDRKRKRWLFMFGCSLFARFSVSTVGLEPSVKTTTSPPFRSTSNESYYRNQWVYKMPHSVFHYNTTVGERLQPAVLKQAGAILNEADTQDRINSPLFTTLFNSDKPGRGLNVQNTGVVL